MKRVLVVYFSQTGQLGRVVDALLGPLRSSGEFQVTTVALQPLVPYPFPWSFWSFFNTFPECMQDDPGPIAALRLPPDAEFDLVVLAYQVWFLSPSLPMTAFLQSDRARQLLAGKPVVTLIACRNMWLMAQERVRAHLHRLGAHLIDNVALTDRTHGAKTVITTPWWLLSGNKGPYLGGLLPVAGVSEADIAAAARFGKAIAAEFPHRVPDDRRPMLRGLGAVVIHTGLIASEQLVQRSLRLWSILLRRCGRPSAPLRRVVLALYVLFLVVMLLTAVPIVFTLRTMLAPLSRRRVVRLREYFAAPSGE